LIHEASEGNFFTNSTKFILFFLQIYRIWYISGYTYNKFYRGRKAKAGGTGLGLSIVKGFVEAHKGSVTAENRQNGGALFTIKLPVEISDINSIKS